MAPASSVASSYMPGYAASEFRGISRLVDDYFNKTSESNSRGYISKSQARRYQQFQGNVPIGIFNWMLVTPIKYIQDVGVRYFRI